MLEKDLEDWIYNNPQDFFKHVFAVDFDRWIGRQVKVGSGIIDLLAQVKTRHGDNLSLIIVELKRDELNADTLSQVMRYKKDVQHAVDFAMSGDPVQEWFIRTLICGKTIDKNTFAAAKAMEIDVMQYEHSYSFGRTQWTNEASNKMYDKNKKFGLSGELAEFAECHKKNFNESLGGING